MKVLMLWGFEASIPDVCRELDEDVAADEGDGCYDRLRRLYGRLTTWESPRS